MRFKKCVCGAQRIPAGTVKTIQKRNDPLENQVISEFRWGRIKRKSGSILLDNQQCA